MQIWIIFVILYGVLKGSREPIKKSILGKVGVLSALFGYTFIGFLMVAPTADGVLALTPQMVLLVIVKSLAVFLAWILGFKGIKHVPVSVYGIFDMSRVIFSTLLGVAFFHESLTVKGIVSLCLIVLGLYFSNQKKNIEAEGYKLKYVFYILLSCFFNAISGTLDKYIMSTGQITSSVLQFWFMFFTSAFYLGYILIKREKLEIKKIFTNPWIYVLSFSLVFGDRLLFLANADPESKVTIMTLLKQSSAIVTIVLGKLIYHEKNILRKLICAAVIILGIVLSVI